MEITPDDIIDRNKPCLYLRSSCIGNPGIGGWGAVLEYRDETEQISGNIAYTTNNRLEILAAVEGVSILPAGSPVQIFTTSDYLFQGATKWVHGWRRRDWKKTSGLVIANADLWQRLDKVMESAEIRWINAKGRSDPGLKAASKLASDAARLLK
ncbi:MAG: ribonuclease H family protein [Candidatus Promineifilaceae bacterium]